LGFFVEGLGSAIMVIIIIISVVWLFSLSLWYMFSIGLIKISDKVRFAKVAGIFGLCVSVLSTIMFLVMLYVLFNPMVVFAIMMSSWISNVLVGYNILSFVLSVGLIVFNSLTLLNASKKYEK